MNITAVICEYNPFHNGHAYQLEQARRQSNADYILAVMSGNFVQRGEPAVINKWARCEMALLNGADIVIEIPSAYTLASAQYYASCAVGLIKALNSASCISCGTSQGREGADILRKMSVQSSAPLKLLLKSGCSYAAAASKLASNGERLHANDILAVEYLRALASAGEATCGGIDLLPIKRSESCKSATQLRQNIYDAEFIEQNTPASALNVIQRELASGRAPVTLESLSDIIVYLLRAIDMGTFGKAANISEGLEHKISAEARKATELVDVIKACTSLRYTASRIRRAIFCASLGVTRELVGVEIPYIRLLGMRRDAGAAIDEIKKHTALPIVTSVATFKRNCDKHAKEVLEAERRATELYVMGYGKRSEALGDQEYTHPCVFI